MDPSKWTPFHFITNEDECKKTLKEPGSWEMVPLLSDYETPRETFVRFKGMIQDMLNPEYFTKTYTVINSVTNETKICQGKYHTASIINDDETVEMGDEMMERQIFACIPIPGLNEWSKDLINSNNEVETNLEGNFNKRIRLDSTCQNNLKEIFIFIYPEDVEKQCELKLNNIVEIVGFLERRPINGIDEDQEGQSKERLCIHAVQLKCCSDLYPISNEKNNYIFEEASNLYSELKLILTQALLGDSLAADYLLFYLISTIYNRQPSLVPGKFSLNIQGIPNSIGKDYTKKLYSLISFLVVRSKYLPITIDNLNKIDMIPRKCYTTNRLLHGFLQLSNRTHLVLDETDLQPGKLDSKGMLNIHGLTDLISTQQIKYDFMYYTIDYETYIPVLTLSIGKSILPCDIDVVLNPDPSYINNIEETMNSALTYLNAQSSLLDKLRKYIAIISTVPFNFKDDVLEDIEKDYVEMRKADVKNISPDDIHRFLMISKLIALCSGKNELNQEAWNTCKTLEKQRKLRNK